MYHQQLLEHKRPLYTTHDLALLWKSQNRQNLRNTIHRYIKKGWLFPIRRGLYSKIPLPKLDPFLLGTAYVSGFCYVSTETVLAQSGVIFQQPAAITLVGLRTLDFIVADRRYLCRKLASQYRQNKSGITQHSDEYSIATPERAAADMLYYQPNYYFDKYDAIDGKRLKFIQNEVYA